MDHHVADAITTNLRQRGVDVMTAREDGATRTDDEALLARATLLGRALFTHDNDFLRIGPDWQRGGRSFAGVIFVSQLSAEVGMCVSHLELIAHGYEPEDLENRVEFLPLR
jgi:hypothetical protein